MNVAYISASHSVEMENFKSQGNKAFGEKDYLEMYTKALQVPNIPDEASGTLYSNRSATYLELKQYENSYSDAKLAQLLRPNWPRAYERKGKALLAMKEYEKAIRGNNELNNHFLMPAYETGLVLNPANEVLSEGRSIANYEQQKINRQEHMDSIFSSPIDHLVQTVCFYFSFLIVV